MKLRGVLSTLSAPLIVWGAAPAIVAAPAASATPASVGAEAALSTHSWDPGLYATVGDSNATVHAWGRRSTPGAWGTGPVNYQAGATTVTTASSSGTLNVTLRGTYCPGAVCSFGAGTGYKGLVQLWNDPQNYIAFGIIHDPGVSPAGTTLMIEGAANGHPVGGYWAGGKLGGASHVFTVTWGTGGVALQIDQQIGLGPYPVTATHPSISFLAAGRLTGDIADTTFTGISINTGSAPPPTSNPGTITFGDGTHQVGASLPPGTYRTRADVAGCYWARLAGFSGEPGDILANNFSNYHQVVTIEPGDAGFESDGCGTWTNDLSELTTSPTAPFGNGTWIVNTDVAPANWSAPGGPNCYWERVSNFTAGTDSILANDFGAITPTVTIAPTDAGFVSENCGTWTSS